MVTIAFRVSRLQLTQGIRGISCQLYWNLREIKAKQFSHGVERYALILLMTNRTDQKEYDFTTNLDN